MIEHYVTKADVKHDLKMLESWMATRCTGECDSCKYKRTELRKITSMFIKICRNLEPREFWMEPKEFCALQMGINGLRDRLKRMRG